MLVDYDWVKAILEGSIEYTQYDVNNQVANTSASGRISYIDIKFKSSRDLIWPWFYLSNEDVAGSTSPFTYSLSSGGPWVKTLEVEKSIIPRNSSLRVFVRTANGYDRTEHAAARLRITPAGDWRPPTWVTSVFGYDLVAVRSDVISFRYFDNAGNERSQADINNANIGSLIVTLNLDDAFPNASFTLGGVNGEANRFSYSFYPGGPWASSLNWNPGNVVNGSAVRVYVQYYDPSDGERRIYSQLNVSGSIGGQARSAVSGSYSFFGSPIPWARTSVPLLIVNMNPDDQGWMYFNLRTGHYKVTVNTGRGSSGGNVNAAGVYWDSGLDWVGGGGSTKEFMSAEHDFPNAANVNIARSSGVNVWLSNVTGRDDVIMEQQPNAGNDWTAVVHIKDPSGGAAAYSFHLNAQVNQ